MAERICVEKKNICEHEHIEFCADFQLSQSNISIISGKSILVMAYQ